MTLRPLKDDLLDRWLTAYDQLPSATPSADNIVKTVFAENFRFSLDKYSPEQFRPAGPLLTVAPPGTVYAYELDAAGRPVSLTVKDSAGNEVIKGHYTYTAALVDYIEYNLQSRLPSCIQRIVYNDGKKDSFQSLTLEGRGAGEDFQGVNKKAVLSALEERELLCECKIYHWSDNRIDSAECLQVLPGNDQMTSREEYSYNSAGELEEIRAIFDDDENVSYLYVRKPDNITLEELADQVAEQMTADIINALAEEVPPEPLAALELHYQEINQYTPYLSLITETQRQEIEEAATKNSLFEDWMTYPDKEAVMIYGRPFERPMAAFMAEVESRNEYALATEMIRKVARLLNAGKLGGRIATGNEFMAYAIDWTMTSGFTNILEACGVAGPIVKKWEQQLTNRP